MTTGRINQVDATLLSCSKATQQHLQSSENECCVTLLSIRAKCDCKCAGLVSDAHTHTSQPPRFTMHTTYSCTSAIHHQLVHQKCIIWCMNYNVDNAPPFQAVSSNSTCHRYSSLDAHIWIERSVLMTTLHTQCYHKHTRNVNRRVPVHLLSWTTNNQMRNLSVFQLAFLQLKHMKTWFFMKKTVKHKLP